MGCTFHFLEKVFFWNTLMYMPDRSAVHCHLSFNAYIFVQLAITSIFKRFCPNHFQISFHWHLCAYAMCIKYWSAEQEIVFKSFIIYVFIKRNIQSQKCCIFTRPKPPKGPKGRKSLLPSQSPSDSVALFFRLFVTFVAHVGVPSLSPPKIDLPRASPHLW